MPTFQTPEPITAHIEAGQGSIRLVATDRADTVIEVRPRDESRASDVRAAEQTRVHWQAGELFVSAMRRGLLGVRAGVVDIDIALPSRSRLNASLASADVRAEGAFAACRFSATSGNIDIDAVAGRIEAATASGSITVHAAEGNVSVSTTSGNSTIADLEGDLKFQAASGSLTVDRLRGTVMTRTASGSVAVVAAVRGALSAHTSSGDVAIGIAEGTAARLDIMTRSGVVSNRLQPSDGPGQGNETCFVQVRSGSGDVDIHRAVHSRGSLSG
jgi:DUF4097 and DUF4098 domain-containing protein YvlB